MDVIGYQRVEPMINALDEPTASLFGLALEL